MNFKRKRKHSSNSCGICKPWKKIGHSLKMPTKDTLILKSINKEIYLINEKVDK